jgi:hypothetical protein
VCRVASYQVIAGSSHARRALRRCARKVVLASASASRGQMRPELRERSFKSGKLYGAARDAQTDDQKAELAELAGVTSQALESCTDVAQVFMTNDSLRNAPPSKMTFVRSGQPPLISTSGQLSMILNAVRALVVKWSSKGALIDVVIDRSMALGLDPRQQEIRADQFSASRTQLLNDPYEVRLVAGADTEPTLRDLLLLPDFLGYVIHRSWADGNMGDVIVAAGTM